MDCMGGCIKFAWIPAIIALFLATLSLVNNAAWNAQNQSSKYPSRYHVLEEAHFPDPRRTFKFSLTIILMILLFFHVLICRGNVTERIPKFIGVHMPVAPDLAVKKL